MLDRDELMNLMRAGESDRVEFKRSASDASGIRRTICAFANDWPGHGQPAVIFIGIDDNGRPGNIRIPDEFQLKVASMRSDGNILPPPMMIVQRMTIDETEVLCVQIPPSPSPPVRYEGRVFVRIGSQNKVATEIEEQRLAERRRAGDLPFDRRPALDATIDDLDMAFFRGTYLPSALPPHTLERNHLPLDRQLSGMGLLTPDASPTLGAILILGLDPLRWVPGAYVQFVRFDGDSLTAPIRDEKELSGPLHDVLRRLDEVLEINISNALDLSQSREIRKPDYPIMALQQLARNAVMHRAYEGTNAPVRLYWFGDRVEISNPGGLYGQVNERNFGEGPTDYRNPLIAEAMKVLGYVQRFGMGVPLARQELARNGNPPPEFQFWPERVLAVVRAAR